MRACVCVCARIRICVYVHVHMKHSKLIRDATILQYIDILQYSLLQYNTIRLMKNIDILHIAIYCNFFAIQVVRIQLLHCKMTEPLVTRNIQYNFMFLLSFFASFKDMICSFISLTTYCNMRIYCNTLKVKDNTQYGINPYCYIPKVATVLFVTAILEALGQSGYFELDHMQVLIDINYHYYIIYSHLCTLCIYLYIYYVPCTAVWLLWIHLELLHYL